MSSDASHSGSDRPVPVPMSEPEYLVFLTAAVPHYAADKVASGEWTTEQSLDLANQSFESLLPEGLQSEGHHFFTIRDDDRAPVGVLWFAEKRRGGNAVALSVQRRHRAGASAPGAREPRFFALEDELQGSVCRASRCICSGTTRAPRPCTRSSGIGRPTSTCSRRSVPTTPDAPLHGYRAGAKGAESASHACKERP